MAARVQDEARRKAAVRQKPRSRRSAAERPSVAKERREAERTVAMFDRLMSTADRHVGFTVDRLFESLAAVPKSQ
jgi:hypothetical protein